MALNLKNMGPNGFVSLCDDIRESYAGSESGMPAVRDIALLALMFYSGLSISSCVKLDTKDIDIQKRTVSVNVTDGTKIITYPDDAAKLLDEYLKVRNGIKTDTEALFLGKKTGRIASERLKQEVLKYDDIIKKYSANSPQKSKSHDNRMFEELLEKLPPFCKTYFVGIAQRTTALTRLNYARDLTIFFAFLKSETEEFAGIEPKSFNVGMLNDVTPEMIEQFLFYVTDYSGTQKTGEDIERFNDIKAKSRKLSAISSMYRYFMLKQQIEKDPVSFVEKPKRRDDAIIRLDPAEVANLLDAIESGEGQSEIQKKHNAPLVARDVAILTLFLGTGIRISECTGINIKDIDISERAVLITRKGQKKQVVYYGQEVEDALFAYLEERMKMKPVEGDEDALFLSTQNRRISNRAVQILVKKYAGIVTPLKHITPHKLRSTFGTNLYQETGDIYLVATVLGHTDVNTTRKHYAQNTEEMRINVVKNVRLRTEKSEDDK